MRALILGGGTGEGRIQEFWRVNLWIGVIFLLMVKMEGNALSLDCLATVARLFITVRFLSFIISSLTIKISKYLTNIKN